MIMGSSSGCSSLQLWSLGLDLACQDGICGFNISNKPRTSTELSTEKASAKAIQPHLRLVPLGLPAMGYRISKPNIGDFIS